MEDEAKSRLLGLEGTALEEMKEETKRLRGEENLLLFGITETPYLLNLDNIVRSKSMPAAGCVFQEHFPQLTRFRLILHVAIICVLGLFI